MNKRQENKKKNNNNKKTGNKENQEKNKNKERNLEKTKQKIKYKEIDENNKKIAVIDKLIVIIFLLGVLILTISITNYYLNKDTSIKDGIKFYKYKYKIGNITYNVYLRHNKEDLMKIYNMIPNVKYDLGNSLSVTLLFDEYKKEDNANVTVASVTLGNFIGKTLHTNVYVNTTNYLKCNNATKYNKIITFNPYSSKNIIYWENPYCLRINSTSSGNLIYLSEALIYKMMNE